MNRSKKHIDEEEMPEAVRKHLASKKRRKRIILTILAALPFALVGLWLWSSSAGDRAIQAEIDRYIAAGEPIFPADFDPPPLRRRRIGGARTLFAVAVGEERAEETKIRPDTVNHASQEQFT